MGYVNCYKLNTSKINVRNEIKFYIFDRVANITINEDGPRKS